MMDTIFTDSKNRVACPASLEHGDLINNALHYTTAAQIAKHGVCRKCRAKMKERSKAILTGKKVETPAAIEHHHTLNIEGDHVGFDAAEVVQITDFDFNEVDEALGFVEATPPDAREQAGELVRQLFAYCFKSKGKVNLTTAAAKLAVIAAGMRPDLLSDASQTELAAQLGLKKATLSKASVKFQDAFGIKFARSRSKQARARMAARRLGGPDRHRKHATVAAADGRGANQLGASNRLVTCETAEAGGQGVGA